MENNDAITILASLAQSTRLDTFKLLVKHEPNGLPAGEIAKSLDVPQNTMSAHLSNLLKADLVISHRQSRSIIYRANLKKLQSLTAFLIDDCCAGHIEICELPADASCCSMKD